jgi:uncharacterized membrane protein
MPEEGQGSEYDLQPPKPAENPPLKPGDPGWVPPTPIIEKADEPEEPEVPVDPDVQNHKAVAILAYIFFVIPLVAAPHSKFARFHANQGLLLFILWCAAFIGIVILNVGWRIISPYLESIAILQFFFGCIVYLLPVFMLVGMFVLTIMGIVNAANGEKKSLPMLAHWSLIK